MNTMFKVSIKKGKELLCIGDEQIPVSLGHFITAILSIEIEQFTEAKELIKTLQKSIKHVYTLHGYENKLDSICEAVRTTIPSILGDRILFRDLLQLAIMDWVKREENDLSSDLDIELMKKNYREKHGDITPFERKSIEEFRGYIISLSGREKSQIHAWRDYFFRPEITDKEHAKKVLEGAKKYLNLLKIGYITLAEIAKDYYTEKISRIIGAQKEGSDRLAITGKVDNQYIEGDTDSFLGIIEMELQYFAENEYALHRCETCRRFFVTKNIFSTHCAEHATPELELEWKRAGETANKRINRTISPTEILSLKKKDYNAWIDAQKTFLRDRGSILDDNLYRTYLKELTDVQLKWYEQCEKNLDLYNQLDAFSKKSIEARIEDYKLLFELPDVKDRAPENYKFRHSL